MEEVKPETINHKADQCFPTIAGSSKSPSIFPASELLTVFFTGASEVRVVGKVVFCPSLGQFNKWGRLFPASSFVSTLDIRPIL